MTLRGGIPLGFEVGSGEPVSIPLRHLAVTGQTQEAGKTTTLEALIARSGLRAVTFVTKRGEGSFVKARRIPPIFREQTDWQYVASILEASRGEKLKFERAWIIRASKGTRTLADVQANVRKALADPKTKAMSADMYLCLDAYLDVVVPQIAAVKWASSLDLAPGVNAMDLGALSLEMQHLVIRAAIQWVLEWGSETVIVVPEAWKFLPQGRGTPVKLAAEAFIRQGAALKNYLWLDSQDIGGIEKSILRSVPVWLLGVQRESNEIKRTLDNIPHSTAKPKAGDIATLKLGEFFACWGDRTVKTYVQPAWMPANHARVLAQGASLQPIDFFQDTRKEEKPEDPTMCEQHQQLERDVATLRRENEKERARAAEQLAELRAALKQANETASSYGERAAAAADLGRALARLLPAGAGGAAGLVIDEDAIVRRVLARIPVGGAGPVTVTPPEKLRKDFQREEVERIVAAARGLRPLQKRVVKLLESTDGNYVSQPTINQRLGRGTSGGSVSDLGSALKELAALGFVEIKERMGARKNIRTKLAADLAFYQASDADVEAVYQNVLHELATEGAEAAA